MIQPDLQGIVRKNILITSLKYSQILFKIIVRTTLTTDRLLMIDLKAAQEA